MSLKKYNLMQYSSSDTTALECIKVNIYFHADIMSVPRQNLENVKISLLKRTFSMLLQY